MRAARPTNTAHVLRTGLRWAVGAVLVVALAALAVGGVLGYRLEPVLSASMRPAYAPGDAVVTRPAPVASVRPGMIIAVVPPGEHTSYAHRVVAVRDDAGHRVVTTKGDANPAPDSWQTVLGAPQVPEVVAVVPSAGRLLVAAHRVSAVAGYLLFVGLATTGLGLRMLRRAIGPDRHPAAPAPTLHP